MHAPRIMRILRLLQSQHPNHHYHYDRHHYSYEYPVLHILGESFAKVTFIVILHSAFRSEQTFENFYQSERRALPPLCSWLPLW